ncbi:hypothetical protein Mal64_31010 [Pseudobythopirellula maris]|uniref:Lactonase, 7-bladed beta-propeller n=1 Tax=Pseudobythopirellula maris TaxID=2527991 RepID=A0A5C5ZJK9_9BACT|nr:hypothetical protein [Pseudobythopirellula maris]TWT87559.1 hypothetical protein Mal64_31010 [Pseudobythopirellula maris]
MAWAPRTMGALGLAAALLLLGLAAPPAVAQSVETLLEGLPSPAALVVRPDGKPDHFELYLASSEPAELIRVVVEHGEAIIASVAPREDSADVAPMAPLAFLTKQTLISASATPGVLLALRMRPSGDGGLVYVAQPTKSADGPAGATPVAALAANGRHVFAVGEGGLLRASHSGVGVSPLGPFGESEHPRQIAISPDGYLAVLQQGESEDTIAFYDPAQPAAEPRTTMPIGLKGAVAIAYGALPRPVDRLLYALVSDPQQPGGDGVYRLDAALGATGHAACRATPVAAVENATAMAFGADGALYLVAVHEGRGALLRLDDSL